MAYVAPNHVWYLILEYLKKPIPLPQSFPPRSAIRQDCLTRAMRLFAAICQPLLYGRVVITDDLPSLLTEPHNHTIYTRLADVQHLRVEYSPNRGVWSLVGISNLAMYEIVKQQCYDEKIFKSLKTIAVGSVYGAGLQHWYKYEAFREDESSKKPSFDCINAVADIVDLLRLQHFCARDWMAPFCLPPMSDTQCDIPNVTRCTRTVYFNYQTIVFPMTVGASVQWVGDLGDDHGKSSLKRLDEQFKKIVLSREELSKDVNFERLPVDIEIYLPSRMTSLGDVADWETFECSKGKLYEQALRKASGHNDKVRFYTGMMEKLCPACGLGVGGS